MVKRKPHHSLAAVQQKFASTETLEMTTSAIMSAQAIGYSRQNIVDAVQRLTGKDFAKSETAHNPPNSKVLA